MIYDKTSVGTIRSIAVTEADNRELRKAHAALTSSETEEWFTPPHIIELVKAVFGGRINLDPASCREANVYVDAISFYDKEDDGLKQPWFAKVFLNPPFGKEGTKSLAGIWLETMYEKYLAGEFREGIALTHTRPGYEWYESMIREVPICQTREKISFISSTGKKGSGSKTSQTFFYFGSNYDRFYEVFSPYGRVIHPDLCP